MFKKAYIHLKKSAALEIKTAPGVDKFVSGVNSSISGGCPVVT